MSVADPTGRVEIGEPSSSVALKEVNILRAAIKRDKNDRLNTSEDGRQAYFGGGFRNPLNVCTFSSPVFEGTDYPSTIKLYLTPNNVIWDYTLKTNIIDTYGGQVIQVLGVSIENMSIQGFFGVEGMWGIDTNPNLTFKADGGSRFDTSDDYLWKDTGPIVNGLFQFSQWFKRYFYLVTQVGNFSSAFMVFKYPHMGWEWIIRPLELPKVRFANNELAPQWQLNCDFIEDMQGTFQSTVNETAKSALGGLQEGVGFLNFVSWSEPVYSSTEDMSTMIKDAGQRYSQFMETELSDKQIKTLITEGYSYPAQNPNNIDSTNFDKYIKDKTLPINTNRLKTLLDEETGAS